MHYLSNFEDECLSDAPMLTWSLKISPLERIGIASTTVTCNAVQEISGVQIGCSFDLIVCGSLLADNSAKALRPAIPWSSAGPLTLKLFGHRYGKGVTLLAQYYCWGLMCVYRRNALDTYSPLLSGDSSCRTY